MRFAAIVALLCTLGAAVAAPAAPPTPSNEHRPIFLPDGDSIVFMSDRADGDWELYRSRLDGSQVQRLTWHPGWDGYADVSPDGRRIAFDRADDDHRGIVLLDLQTGAEEWLLRFPAGFGGGAGFAPDGESLIYASEESGNREVYRLWLGDRRIERLSDSPDEEGDAVFSPDGKHIAWAVRNDSGSAVEVFDVRRRTTRRIVETGGRLYGLDWSPDGEHIFFNDDADGDQEIFVVAAAGGAARKLTDNDVADHLPSAAPADNRIIFTSERAGAEKVFVMDVTSGSTIRVDLGDGVTPLDPSADTLALVNVQVVSVADGTVLRDAVVLVRDGRIEAVGGRYDVAVPLDVRRIDGAGGYALPGLIDAHVHLRRANTLRLYLARGFTTVRDMNGNLSRTRAARDLVAAGELPGPRVVAASPTMLTDPFNDYPAPTTAAEGAALAQRFAAEGYDLIKVFRVRRDAFVGLMEEARALGMPVAGHLPDASLDEEVDYGIPFDEVLHSGMTSLEHITEVALAGTGGLEHLDRLDDVAGMVARSGIAVGTIAASMSRFDAFRADREAWIAAHRDTILRYTGDAGVAALRAADMSQAAQRPPVPQEAVLRIIRSFHRAGVPLVLGTDSHYPLVPAGDAGLDELEFLVAAGLSGHEALLAATATAAEVLGLGAETGRLAPSLAADLLLVAVNPLDDIAAVRHPLGVMAAGIWRDQNELERLVATAIAEGLW